MASKSKLIAVGVGYFFSLVPTHLTKHIDLKKSNIDIIVDNVVYPMYKGKTYEDSTYIDELLDTHTELKIKDYRYGE